MNRGKILEAWRRKRSAGELLSGGRSGGDFILVSNEDKLELRGATGLAGLLPLGDANALSLAALKERASSAAGVPLIAGVCGTDPLRLMDKFLQEMKAAGAAGIQNFPSVGLIDGGFRTNLEEAKLGFGREVDLVRLAGKLDLVTVMLVFSADDARAMGEAGADAVVIHPGLGERPSKFSAEIASAARESRKDLLVLGYRSASIDGIQTDGRTGVV